MRINCRMGKMAVMTCILACLAGLTSLAFQAAGDEAVIAKPKSGETIANREAFTVEGSIKDFRSGRTQGFHYWISLAESSHGKLGDLHWPKFYVKSEIFQDKAFDGGSNPLPTPEEKWIVILKVDEKANNSIISWFQDSKATGNYPALPLHRDWVIAQKLIYFP